MVEYGLLIAGVALVSAAAISLFGNKTDDMFAAIAAILPGVHAEDNGPVWSNGILLETSSSADGPLGLDGAAINANSNTERLGDNMGLSLSDLVVQPQ